MPYSWRLGGRTDSAGDSADAERRRDQRRCSVWSPDHYVQSVTGSFTSECAGLRVLLTV
jgi:hypothetical protein